MTLREEYTAKPEEYGSLPHRSYPLYAICPQCKYGFLSRGNTYCSECCETEAGQDNQSMDMESDI